MTPVEAFPISILLLVVIPTLILIVGTIVFLTKTKYSKIVGFAQTSIGAGELITWMSITRDFTSFVNFIYLLTLLIGVSSLAYAYRTPTK